MPLPVAYQNQFKSVHVKGYLLPECNQACHLDKSQDLVSCCLDSRVRGDSKLRDILSQSEKLILSAISSPSMNHQKSWSFILTRMVLGEVLQQDPKSLKIDRVGKPALFDGVLQFNVSHSANLWIIAWSFEREVGIDVQKIDASINYQAIMRQFFTKSEQAQVNAISDFFDIWTQKEAALKLKGLGFVSMPKIVTSSAEFISLDISPEFKAHLAI